MTPEWYIGLMSGTSMDGIDGALCRFEDGGRWAGVAAHTHRPLAPPLRGALQALQSSGADELHRAAMAANGLALAYAEVCTDLLQMAELPPAAVRAVGAHGQTVRHQPHHADGMGYTWQVNAPALLAERCGIDVVADLRARDVAAGGQGAPLVPPFHQAVFARPDRVRAVANVGGIANLTLLHPGQPVIGFDCGPGNALLDHWCERHTGRSFDEGGTWGAGGVVVPALLDALLSEPYFSAPAPKSTGRDLFNAAWLDAHREAVWSARPEDVQATLCELTAAVIANAVQGCGGTVEELLVCGGGVHNADLMARLSRRLPTLEVRSTAAVGLPPQQVEAAAFAWLARQHCHRDAGNLPSVTGAAGLRILGALYPA